MVSLRPAPKRHTPQEPMKLRPLAFSLPLHLSHAPLCLALLVTCMAAVAQPRPAAPAGDIEQVRATTTKLINLLIEQGVLTRTRAEALLREMDATAPAPAAAGAVAAAPGGAAAPAAAAAPVRVPYIPEFVRKELKDELRNEIAAQGLREGWAGPGAVPAWVRGLRFEGDLRTRLQSDMFANGNAPTINVQETNRTRTVTLLNTSQDRQRLRVRARLGVTATADEYWSAGVRLTTGNTTDPVSSNQTLGNFNNRYTVAFDRAHIRYSHSDLLNVVAGRFGNPWYGSDLVWANDLSFDGVAVQWTPRLWGNNRGFLTAAAVPVQEVELSNRDKWLFGLQAGVDMPGNNIVRGKVGLAYYVYKNMAGQPNAAGSSLNDFTAPAFVQKGNTYYNISSDPARPLLALAADYRIVNLTGTLSIETVLGKTLTLTTDFARNVGYDRAAVSARLGEDVAAKTSAYLMRVAFGDAEVSKRHDWQAFFGYKHVERDAVLDAFTDSDLRLGGTDAKGFVLGGSYGVGRNSVATLRWLSADSVSGAPLSVDTLHVDLSLRF